MSANNMSSRNVSSRNMSAGITSAHLRAAGAIKHFVQSARFVGKVGTPSDRSRAHNSFRYIPGSGVVQDADHVALCFSKAF